MINLDTIIGIVLGVPLGILIGYRWRDRISQQCRAQYLAERTERERRAAMERERKSRARPQHWLALVAGPDFLLIRGY
jgi:hypothetical protein